MSLVSCRCNFDISPEVLSTNGRIFPAGPKMELIDNFLRNKKFFFLKLLQRTMNCNFADLVEKKIAEKLKTYSSSSEKD